MKALRNFLPSLTAVILVVILSIVMRFTLFAADLSTSRHDTDGTTFTIATEADLKDLSRLVGQGEDFSGTTIVLTESIVLTENFTPIGTISKHFSGTFDGNHNTISTESGVVIGDAHEYYQGLFGYTENATIKNLTMDATVVGKGMVGAIVGFFYASDADAVATVENCSNIGSVTSTAKDGGVVGGLVGYCNTDAASSILLSNSNNSGAIYSAGANVGGLIGGVYGNATVLVENSYNTGDVEGTTQVGGLIASNNGGTISNCYNTGNVRGIEEIGGLVGYHTNKTGASTVEFSHNSGIVSGFAKVGSAIGENHGGTVTTADVSHDEPETPVNDEHYEGIITMDMSFGDEKKRNVTSNPLQEIAMA